jgi:hypothetical protein
MDIQNVVSALRSERARLDRAIAALESLSQPAPRRGRPPQVKNGRSRLETAPGERSRPQANLRGYEAAVGEMEG